MINKKNCKKEILLEVYDKENDKLIYSNRYNTEEEAKKDFNKRDKAREIYALLFDCKILK